MTFIIKDSKGIQYSNQNQMYYPRPETAGDEESTRSRIIAETQENKSMLDDQFCQASHEYLEQCKHTKKETDEASNMRKTRNGKNMNRTKSEMTIGGVDPFSTFYNFNVSKIKPGPLKMDMKVSVEN